MSFLYKIKKIVSFLSKHNNINDKPSPTCKKGFCLNRISFVVKFIKIYIRRMSRFSSFSGMKGSMTVEASIVLPLFIFFFLQICGFMEMLRLHANLEYGLWKAGKTLMLYGAVEELAEQVPELAVSYLYVNGVLQGTLGQEYLDTSPLTYGRAGMNFLESDIIDEEDEVNLTLTYQVSPRGQLLPFGYVRLSNRFYGRAWTGYDVVAEEKETQVAYVTKYGEVWHTTKECSHLKLTIQMVNAVGLSNTRNKWGQSYGKCSFCAKGAMPERLYITEEGDCYHYAEGCPGLTRHVEIITWESREKYRACNRCAGG